jgi:Fe2+ or Zn2+ uptake regulation protein
MRLTPRRQAVLDVLRSATDHPTAADVYERVRAQLPGVGPATIYRALGRLVSEGHARELDLGSPSARYESNLRRHDHVVCRRCGRAVDIDVPLGAGVAAGVADRTGFTVTEYELSFRGICPDCSTAAGAGRQESDKTQTVTGPITE